MEFNFFVYKKNCIRDLCPQTKRPIPTLSGVYDTIFLYYFEASGVLCDKKISARLKG